MRQGGRVCIVHQDHADLKSSKSSSKPPESIKEDPDFRIVKNTTERGPAVSSPGQNGGKCMEMKNHRKNGDTRWQLR
jgi:hypothetical protein